MEEPHWLVEKQYTIYSNNYSINLSKQKHEKEMHINKNDKVYIIYP